MISLVQFIISLLLVLIPSSFAESFTSKSSEIIPNILERIVKEGTTFNITCRFTLTNYTGRIDKIDEQVIWSLPDIFDEEEMPISKVLNLINIILYQIKEFLYNPNMNVFRNTKVH